MKDIIIVDDFLEELLRQIDISPSHYKTAIERFDVIRELLISGDVANEVYVQGSFALGTVVRPIAQEEEPEYDLDVVSFLQINKEMLSPENIKRAVLKCIKSSPNHAPLLDEEGSKCWTLKYAPQNGVGFHLDILPAADETIANKQRIIDKGVFQQYANQAIAITKKDKTSGIYKWDTSNPGGFADWFYEINSPYSLHSMQSEQQRLFSSNYYKSVDEIPIPLYRSVVQKAIQILKRHRDCKFVGTKLEDYKPISIIITTLVTRTAERVQQFDITLHDFLNVVICNLSDLVGTMRSSSAEWKIPNPVNPYENFANRWHEDNDARAKAFFDWSDSLKIDFLFDKKPSAEMFTILSSIFGAKAILKVYTALDLNPKKYNSPTIIIDTPDKPKPYYKP